MRKTNKKNSLVVLFTLIELFLVLIFILLVITTFFEEDRTILLAQNEHFAKGLKNSEYKTEALREALIDTRDVIKELHIALDSLHRELNEQKSSRDFPPCWLGPNSKEIEYLYTIIIGEEDIKVEPAWPVNRNSEVKLIPGATELISPSLSLEEFKEKAAKVYNWSVANDCRFYVRIIDKTTSKSAFKNKFLSIEAFFYIYLIPDE